MSVVILAEKPSQAKSYAEAFSVEKRDRTHIVLKACSTFPKGAVITWGIGHLVGLKMPNEYKEEWGKWNLANLPIFPAEHEYKVVADKKVQFNAIKKLFQQADVIINGCDIDREGSNIFYSIYNMTCVKNKKIKRLWINSLEVDEIRKGFNNLLENKKDLLMYQEAKARQISDWLVGMNASQLFTLSLQAKGYDGVLSVGRVQSPTVYMIYERQKEIENFVSKPFYELSSMFEHPNGKYVGKAKIKESKKDAVLSVLKNHGLMNLRYDRAVIKDVVKQRKKTKSPLLHSLSTLQTIANKKWKYSPTNVLEIMQSLYEKKMVTYPRTDCNYITDSEFNYLVQNVTEYQSLVNISFPANTEKQKRYVDGAKVEEHYAIIPTKQIPTNNDVISLSQAEKDIYFEIVRNTLAMFHSDYLYEETKIVTNVKGIDFFTTGKVEVEKGWKSLFLSGKAQKSDNVNKKDAEKVLPSVVKEDLVVSVLEVLEGKTIPPKAYTEGALINLMKTAGKGLESDEDSAILKEVEGIGTEATRSGIIETIKRNGYIAVTKNIVSVTDKGVVLCSAIERNLLSSPVMTAKWEKYLKTIGQGSGSLDAFLGNIEKFIVAMIKDAPEKIKDVRLPASVMKKDSEGIADCQKCDGVISDRGKFYGCSGYSNGCRFSLPKKWSGKTIPKGDIKKLIVAGKSGLIKGFKSTKGKSYNAYLVLKNGGKIGMEFEKRR